MTLLIKTGNIKHRSLSIILIMAVLIVGFNFTSFSFAIPGNDSIYVLGNKIYSPDGKELFMRGVNTLDVYYLRPQGDPYYNKHLEAINIAAQKGVNAVRITWNIVADKTYPQLNKLAKLKELERTLLFCRKLNLTVVLTLHYSDYIDQLKKSGQYGIDDEHKIDPTLLAHLNYLMNDAKDIINKNRDILILNFINELGSFQSPRTEWVVAHSYAITALRNAGIRNCLAINAANWGKEPESILKYGNHLLDIDPLHNICFDLHAYYFKIETPYLGNLETFEAMLDALLSRNLAFFYGEFANKNSDIDQAVDPAVLFEIFNRKRIGYFLYVLYNNGPSMRHHNISEDFCQTFRDWGDLYKNHKKTVFDYIKDGATDLNRTLFTSDNQESFLYGDITKDILSKCPIYGYVGWTPQEGSLNTTIDTQITRNIPLVDYSKYAQSLHSIVLSETSTTESQLNITRLVNTPTPSPTLTPPTKLPKPSTTPSGDETSSSNSFSDNVSAMFENISKTFINIGKFISEYLNKFQNYLNT